MAVGRRAVTIGGHTFSRWEVLAVVLLMAATVSLVVGFTVHHQPDRPSLQAATAPIGPTRPHPAATTATPPTVITTAASTSRIREPSATGRPTTHASKSSVPPTRPKATTPTTTPTTTTPTPTSSKAPVVRASLPPSDGTTVMAPSDPVHISVPAIGVSSDMPELGLNPDGTVEVPPLAANSEAGWYRFSATPGSVGSAVVLGHIDSAAYGPGIFYHLGDLNPGDEIDITRADRSTAVFRVDRVAEYPKTAFPTSLIYNPTTYPSLRLITCGGAFDAQARNYLDNIIVFATLTSTRT